MRQGVPGTVELAALVRFSLCCASLAAGVAGVGCAKPAAVPPGPPFAMPAAGAATDTSLRIGDSFPEIQAVDLDGNAVALDQQLLGERYTLVVFWSTWCGFCMHELPHEVELAQQYEGAGLRVIGVNADDTTAIAKAAAKDHELPWLNLFEGPEKTISNQLGIKQWPAILLLDRDGKIVSATQPLRSIAAEQLPDGTVRAVSGLDWTLQRLLAGMAGRDEE